ncbi:methyltransferase domain-containing protein [Gryllotalpicola ginsengisoli]|uniref:methyltransferase domain-containing protein n=1 Tax=Gryllotalpicola ginsengisoli TaxID=444608 RepID=UPI0003B72FA6|nr:methyltransferase domain-containing protein [Gryllotalpicola ginsengisoli]
MNLTHRDTAAVELMDGPCDEARLFTTYRRFELANRAVSGWRGLYRSRIRPLLSPQRQTTLLDVGFGGGDIPRALAAWARRDGLRLDVTAIDPDERALRFAAETDREGMVRYRRASTTELVAAGERYDIVVSNHVLHHLTDASREALFADSERLARRLALHDDIERSRLAYGLYAVGALAIAPGSFARTDGLISIRRSYTAGELARVVPPGWSVESLPRWRVLAFRAFETPPAAAPQASTSRSLSAVLSLSKGRPRSGRLEGWSLRRLRSGRLEGWSLRRLRRGRLEGWSLRRLRRGRLEGWSLRRPRRGRLEGSAPEEHR